MEQLMVIQNVEAIVRRGNQSLRFQKDFGKISATYFGIKPRRLGDPGGLYQGSSTSSEEQ